MTEQQTVTLTLPVEQFDKLLTAYWNGIQTFDWGEIAAWEVDLAAALMLAREQAA